MPPTVRKIAAAIATLLCATILHAQIWPQELNREVRDAMTRLSDGRTMSFDDWTQYAPGAAYLVCRGGEGLLGRSCAMLGGYACLAVTTRLTKVLVQEPRPDGSGNDSFPSGHTGTAFLGAELVRMEYGNGWGAAAYGIAGMTGFMRLWNDRHWLGDVVAGAGFGILSAHAGVWMEQQVRRIFPGLSGHASYDPISGTPLLALNVRF